ncbi:hypothetical protein GQX73_g9652 [Xylaria multiplex]|uniref:Uncharacterized protein n=1 Tax=Xylaria multiplex TaxID=323545 RepID=A0A7C8MJ82_9PEZI|nr:hypothetical protein GQX73_g9652 [Xylaria multiplex]
MATTIPNPAKARGVNWPPELKKALFEAQHQDAIDRIVGTFKEAPGQAWTFRCFHSKYYHSFEIISTDEMLLYLKRQVSAAVKAALIDWKNEVVFIDDRELHYHTSIIFTMSGGGAASVPYPMAGRPSPSTVAPNMSNEEFKDFQKIYENRLLPAIIERLNAANIGGQVYFLKRKLVSVVTPEEAPSSLKEEIECVVTEILSRDLRAKISLDFGVGEVRRT